ncbi:uncharacterized protein THITE_157532 [Thermothielavioides terrestris NRRL 8126]|uniref:Uncharacterized protein n=1 Tax=Thermothielavioides terrestris (strain ATCC 38088 / NRRL 8126) TaxID=578455 RepID=G2RD73_THETT|nr:uncharacterized protein THITE_157532 [Thermothielavioides terrestris NRRL 8126]AEO69908.1 hypothetical protein THITE_157532 [Thermothielavioides terrestris NRRL 8126]
MMKVFDSEGAASALAATTLRFGLGWGNSVSGFITAAFTPVPVLFYKYDQSLRKKFPLKLQALNSCKMDIVALTCGGNPRGWAG